MPIEFNVDPYNDDFNATNGPRENNYMRILFKPGFAVQARELTQLQTVLQNQIKMFGNHVFQDGSQVVGGHLTFDNSVISLKLQNQFANTDVDTSEFLNKLITNNEGPSNKKAKVIAVDDTQENKTLLIRYVFGSEFQNGDVIKVVPGNDPKATLLASGSANVGSIISINEGIFYVNGFFVNVPEQTIVLDPYSRVPTYRVGLEIQETIIDDSADSTLLDPAQGSFNYQAPGADRYQFSLILSKRTLDSVDDSSFFELLRVEEGVITKQVKYPVYSEIEKTLARRTYDESGNYTVYPFRASSSENAANSDFFNVDIDSGKAYVKGFEFETVGRTTIPVKKARTTEIISDYQLSLEFGNYITVRNLFGGNTGLFDTTQFANLDFHIVPTVQIDTTSEGSYKTTLAGTAKARSLQRTDSERFDLYIIDENMSKNTFTLTSSSNTTAFTFPSNYPSLPEGLYDGVSFTVTSGTGSGQSRRIAKYNTARIATVDRPFDTTLDTTSVITLNYSIADVDSIVVKPTSFGANVFGGQESTKARFPSMDVDSYSESSLGETFLSRTGFNKLIYPLPETNISNTDFSGVEFYHRKQLLNQTFNSGSIPGKLSLSVSGKEVYYYGSVGQTLSTSVAEENILVLVKDKQNSSYSNGQVLVLTPTGTENAIRSGTSTIDIYAGNQVFTADVFINVKINNATDSPSTQKEKLSRGGNKNSIADVSLDWATTSVINQTSTKIDVANGVVWYTNTSNINKIPGEKQSLFLSDVIKINKIYDSGNVSFAPNTLNAIDITDNYLFDTGQRDNYYDHGSIILKDGKSPPSGQSVVLLTYFDHVGTSGYFDATSYSGEDIANNYVAVYSSSTVGTTSLLDVIDFRPRRSDATTAFTFGGLLLPYTNLGMELTYGYYIPRIDKIAVSSNKEFVIIPGLPAKYPKPPADTQDTMTIYTMFIPPYTRKATDVKFQFHDNRRYTMRDIGQIEKRVERLEYYTQLSLLEQQARDETYFYEDRTIEKEKYGILVDQFDGFNIADNKNPDLICHISFNQLKPYKKITPIEMEFVSNTAPYKLNSKTYSLNYTEAELISQNSASKAISVQPYMFGTFNGEVELRPEIDSWISETQLPEVVSIDPIQNERPPDVTPVVPMVFPPIEINFPAPQVAQLPQPAIVTSEPQPTAVVTTVPITGDILTPAGWDTTIFDVPRNDIQTVTTVVDTIISPPQIDLGIFPITPIGDLSGLSQWSLFVSDLLTTSTPTAEVPQPPPRPPRGAQSGGFRSDSSRSSGVGRGSVGRGLRRA